VSSKDFFENVDSSAEKPSAALVATDYVALRQEYFVQCTNWKILVAGFRSDYLKTKVF